MMENQRKLRQQHDQNFKMEEKPFENKYYSVSIPPPPGWLGGGELIISEKSFLGVRGQKFLFWWRGAELFCWGGRARNF